MFGKKWRKQLQSSLEITIDLLNLMDMMVQELPEASKEKYELATKYIIEGKVAMKDGKIVGLKQ